METIQLDLGKKSYPIHIQKGLIKNIPELLSNVNFKQKWVIITQHRLMDSFGFELLSSLKKNNYNIDSKLAKKFRENFTGTKNIPNFGEMKSTARQFTEAGIDAKTFFKIYNLWTHAFNSF